MNVKIFIPMKQEEKLKLNPTVFIVLVVYPLLLVALGVWYTTQYGISSSEIILFVATYYIANISIGVGLHRCWSHGAYKLNKVVEFILAMISAGTLQGPALVWCSDHYKHHTFTDEEGDPHTPKKYENGLKGFLWAHMGWMLLGNGSQQVDKLTIVKLGRNKILRWQMKYYWQIAVFMNAVLPPIIGFIIGGTWLSALSAFIFMGLARALQQQMTFCVNSACHFIGSRKYYDGTARDIWWGFVFLLGENWHNFHHAFARDYRNGVKWYHFDVHKWIIYALEQVGLATELVRTPEIRIQAKVEETRQLIESGIKNKLTLIEEAAAFMAKAADERLKQAEKSAHVQIAALRAKAIMLSTYAKTILSSQGAVHKSIADKCSKQFQKLEKLARSLNIKLPQMQSQRS